LQKAITFSNYNCDVANCIYSVNCRCKRRFCKWNFFFISTNFNPRTLTVVVFFLSFYIIAGGLAAEEILLKNNNYIKISIRNAFATLFSYCLLLIIIIVIVKGDLNGVLSLADKDIRNYVAFLGITLFLFFTITWTVIGYRIKNLLKEI
jgi:hypothetical protein